MTYFVRNGKSFMPVAEAELDVHPVLPVGNYVIKKNPQTEALYFQRVDEFSLPSRMYGNTVRHAERIVSTFNDRPKSTGVLLAGEKGSGKTLLASALSIKCAELGYPTIIVSQPWVGEDFNQLIQGIQQPAVVFFDEFEKTYDDKTQEQLLTLLDGTFPSKKLFVLTCNDSWRVNSHMTNRPGRIYYMLDFRGLTIEFIKEYCFDNLVATHYTESICKLSSLFDQFNFDMLKALVEEMNRYNESPLEVMELLNTKPRKGDDGKFSVLLFNAKNQKIKPYNNTYEGNPLANLNFEIMFRRSSAEIAVESPVTEVQATWSPGSVAGSLAGSIDDYDSEPEVDDDVLSGDSTWVTLHFIASNLTEFNAAAGTLTYVNVNGFRVVFTRLKPVYANFTGLLA